MKKTKICNRGLLLCTQFELIIAAGNITTCLCMISG